MDRHSVTAVIGEARIFRTLHEAIAAVRSGALEAGAKR
jgi:sulfate permease, SulP family